MFNHWIKPLGHEMFTVLKYHPTDVHALEEQSASVSNDQTYIVYSETDRAQVPCDVRHWERYKVTS